MLSPGRTQSYEGHSDCLPQISSLVFRKSYQCARPPGGRGRRGIRNQLRQMITYFSRSVTIYISVSQVPPPPCHLPSHTYQGLSRSIITTRVNGQSKCPKKTPPFLISKLNSSCSFCTNFFFCLFFCFTAPNSSWEVPQITRRKGIRLWCLKHSRRKLMKEAYLDSRKEAREPEREKRAWWMLLWEVMIVAFRLVVGMGGARGWGVDLADDKRKISFWKVPLSFLFLLKAFFPRWYRTHTHTHTHRIIYYDHFYSRGRF